MLLKLNQVVLLVLFLVLNVTSSYNNVCHSLRDYYSIRDNPNCWYNVAAEGNIIDIIVYYGYPVQEHKVLTHDGYILSMFRIPNNHLDGEKRKDPVLLMHNWLGSAAVFVGLGNQSLAITLADAGYDVWLGNFRGTEYSEEHVNLTVYNKQYWDYTIDHLALYDIPAQLEHITATTGRRGIIYIGFSMGTATGFMYSSTFPEETKQTVKLFIFLGPGGQLFNNKSILLRSLSFIMDIIMKIVEENDLIRLLSHASVIRSLSRLLCLESPILMERCLQLAFWLGLGAHSQTHASEYPVGYNQLPSGISLRVLRHITGILKYGLSRYDYGAKNIEVYGTLYPPLYNISRIEVPIFMIYGATDWFTTEKDALQTYSRLSPKARIYGVYKIKSATFNHIDFIYGKNVRSLVYEPILRLLQKANEF